MLLYLFEGYDKNEKLVTFKLSQFGIDSAGVAEVAAKYRSENGFASVKIYEAEWVETTQPVGFGEYKITKKIGKI